MPNSSVHTVDTDKGK